MIMTTQPGDDPVRQAPIGFRPEGDLRDRLDRFAAATHRNLTQSINYLLLWALDTYDRQQRGSGSEENIR